MRSYVERKSQQLSSPLFTGPNSPRNIFLSGESVKCKFQVEIKITGHFEANLYRMYILTEKSDSTKDAKINAVITKA